MIEMYIHVRKAVYGAGQIQGDISDVYATARKSVESAMPHSDTLAGSVGVTPNGSIGSQPTPPMLPSPASIAPANSANSTPTGRASEVPVNGSSGVSAPLPAHHGPPPHAAAPPRPAKLPHSSKEQPPPIANKINVPISAMLTHQVTQVVGEVVAASHCTEKSAPALTLAVMAKHFPKTFARIIHSSLNHTEESEPDMEDDEGELFWPGSAQLGEGIGWLCTMAKAMVKEFGRDYGYMGYGGAVRKPEGLAAPPPPSRR